MATLYGAVVLPRGIVLEDSRPNVEDAPEGRRNNIALAPPPAPAPASPHANLTLTPKAFAMTYPHHTTRSKVRCLYFVLVTQLRDQVPALRNALLEFTWAMRRLLGQVHSFDDAKRMNILPGSRTIDSENIPGIHNDLVRSLCLLEGCLIISFLIPGLHHFTHYGQYTMTLGLLHILWMMSFERFVVNYIRASSLPSHIYSHPLPQCRFNKFIKDLVRNRQSPEVHLSHSATLDAAAHFLDMSERGKYDPAHDLAHNCFLSMPRTRVNFLTADELSSFRFASVDVDVFSVSEYAVAYILGVHFRANEWGMSPRCGSVVTCVIEGRSLYARVNKFLRVEHDDCSGYASVTWFGVPEYPFDHPLVTRVNLDGPDLNREYGCIIKITQIDPSPVMVECPEHAGGAYHMMRDSGYDTRRTPPRT